MKTVLLIVAVLLSMVAGVASAQEVVVTGFPLGVGGSVDRHFFESYRTDLKSIADSLRNNPFARAIIVGSADGGRFRNNNDAKNPGLALGRAHALRNWLIGQFKVDSNQLVIQSKDVAPIGPRYRSVSIRLLSERTSIESRHVAAAMPNAGAQPGGPTEMHGTDLVEHMGLQVGAGVTTSPYGGTPFVSGAVTWKRRIFVEGVLGYTLWDGSFLYKNASLDTRRRLAGGAVTFYPLSKVPIAGVIGWVRVEEVSQTFYQYVKLSEGPFFGLRTSILDFVTITGGYNPVKQRVAGLSISHAKNDQFLLSVGITKTFGGLR